MFSRTPRPSIRRAAAQAASHLQIERPAAACAVISPTTSPPRRRWEIAGKFTQDRHACEARGQKRRLTIRRLGQIFNRSVPCDFAQLARENVIRFLEQVGCGGKLFRKVASIPTVCAPWPAKGARFFFA